MTLLPISVTLSMESMQYVVLFIIQRGPKTISLANLYITKCQTGWSTYMDTTQLVSGSWWWDLSQISHECAEIMRDLVEIEWRRSHESRSTHLLGFVFILCYFYEYISITIAYFDLKYYELFLSSKSSSSLITASDIFHISAPWCYSKHPLSLNCDVTMGMWFCLDNYITWQWVDKVYVSLQLYRAIASGRVGLGIGIMIYTMGRWCSH